MKRTRDQIDIDAVANANAYAGSGSVQRVGAKVSRPGSPQDRHTGDQPIGDQQTSVEWAIDQRSTGSVHLDGALVLVLGVVIGFLIVQVAVV